MPDVVGEAKALISNHIIFFDRHKRLGEDLAKLALSRSEVHNDHLHVMFPGGIE